MYNIIFLTVSIYSFYKKYLWNFYFCDLKQKSNKNNKWDE